MLFLAPAPHPLCLSPTSSVHSKTACKDSDLVHWEDLEGSGGEGGGSGDREGNTCKPMAVSFQCMTKSSTI